MSDSVEAPKTTPKPDAKTAEASTPAAKPPSQTAAATPPAPQAKTAAAEVPKPTPKPKPQIHVYSRQKDQHVVGEGCWCLPTVKVVDGEKIVVHKR